MPGITEDGFEGALLPEIREEMEEDIRAELGEGINLDDRSPEGQLVGVFAEKLHELWEILEQAYGSAYPDSASGINLDRVASITNVTRQGAQFSRVTARIYGTQDQVIGPTDLYVSVDGNPSAVFQNNEEAVLETAYNEIQTISFSALPASGTWKLTFDGQETTALAHNANAAAILAALEALSNIAPGDVTVAGDYVAGFIITFLATYAATDVDMLEVSENTLEDSGTDPVDVTVEETVAGGYADDVEFLAQVTGPIQAPARSLTVIETPTVGIDRVINYEAADPGNTEESDPDFRVRRAETLQRSGTAPLDGIRNAVADVDNVDQAFVFENPTDVEDAEGRPPHSIEVVAEGGDDQEIADAIWSSKAAGIATFGDEEVEVEDTQGDAHTVKFNRPEDVEIWMEVDIVPNTDPNETDLYPVDGNDRVKAEILAYAAANQPIGRDVITTKYYIPINGVPGVNDITIRIGIAVNPTTDANIEITSRQRAVFDAARIVVATP